MSSCGGVGREDDQHVRMGLDEDPGFALIGVAQVVAGADGLGYTLFQVRRVADAGAVAAHAAEVGQTVGFSGIEAVDRLGQHQSQCVFACPPRAGKDERMREPLGPHCLAQMRHCRSITEEFLRSPWIECKVSFLSFQLSAPSTQPAGGRSRLCSTRRLIFYKRMRIDCTHSRFLGNGRKRYVN